MSTPESSGVLVVCGMAAEARIARGRGTAHAMSVLAGGGDQERLARELAAEAPRSRAASLSWTV